MKRNLKINKEIDLIKRLNNKKFKIFRLPVPLYRYRMHKNNLSNKNGSKKVKNHLLLLKQELIMGIILR